MPSVVVRLVARIRALRAAQWVGAQGQRFRQTIRDCSDGQDAPTLLTEAAKRAAVGKVNQHYAEAVKNFATAEEIRMNEAYARETFQHRARQEAAKADQEETRARLLRIDELHARVKLCDELRKVNAIPIFDGQGNVRIVRAPESFDWDTHRARVLTTTEIVEVQETDEIKKLAD